MALSSKKKFVSLIAIFLTAVILLSSTFAWQSINQEALNELRGIVNPGGRLHDDFYNISFDVDSEGSPLYTTKTYDKDVYVENFTSLLDDGVQIYARVRLDEYMEVGPGAGTDSAEKQVTVLGDGTARYENRSTWATYLPGDTSSDFRTYWNWSFGGQTSYMPTFNKNKDSLAADINGTSTAGFADYVDYTRLENQTKEYYAIYDLDENDVDELAEGNVDLGALIKGTMPLEEQYQTNVRKALETHAVKNTIKGRVISMEDWLTVYDQQPGSYWVWDSDGWAYWANPIMPETATGLLLDQIARTNTAIESTEWYYGINVVAQFITADSLGYEDSTGFFDTTRGKAPSNNALMLLTAIGVDTGSADSPTPIVGTNAAQVGSEQELRQALANGSSNITLTDDIWLTEPVVVEDHTTLYLDGYQLAADSDFEGSSLIVVRGGAWLDIDDNGVLYAPENGYAVVVQQNSQLYIWQGTYAGGAGVVYVEQGEAMIADGTFYLQNSSGALLGWNSDGSAKITVRGGSFSGFDPSNAGGTNLLDEGFVAEGQPQGETTWYTVVANTQPVLPTDEPQEELPAEDEAEDEEEDPTEEQPEEQPETEPDSSTTPNEAAPEGEPTAPEGGQPENGDTQQTVAGGGIAGKADPQPAEDEGESTAGEQPEQSSAD